MIGWYWLIPAFALGALSCVVVPWEDVLVVFFEIIFFVPVLFYKWFIRWIIKPIPQTRWEYVQTAKEFERTKFIHVFGNVWIGYDKQSTNWATRIFFFRVKKTS